MHKLLPASLALALASPLSGLAATPTEPAPDRAADITALRQEINDMRATYEARLQAMEQRLKAAEDQAATTTNAATLPLNVAAATPSAAAAETSVAPAAAAAGGGANAFNPSMSLILSGLYTNTSQDPAKYAITGFQLPANAGAGPGTRGFSLSESELGFAASIDPWLRGAANISLHADNTVSVEEAYVQTTSLSNGLSLKAGRYFSGLGYLNSQHSHTWDFVDNPLAYQAMLGTQYADDGVQLTWLAPIDQYLQLGVEIGRGLTYPGSDSSRNGIGAYTLTAHTGGDIGDSHTWRAGVSLLSAKATDQSLVAMDSTGATVNNSFTGNTQVWVVDAVWKWSPDGNATRTNFKLQGEYLHSTRDGMLVYDLGTANSAGSYRATQSGWYVQGVYQFMPRWRVALRTEQLNAGSPDYGINAPSFANTGYRPSKNSLMFDFSPSEFSRVRLQFAQDRSREGATDHQLFLQYQMSLGAHGAHSY